MGRTVAAIQSITADQARDFATRYLARRARARRAAGADGRQSGSGRGERRRARDGRAGAGRGAVAAGASRRSQPIRFLRDLHRVTLPNGLETIIIRRPGASVVTAALGVHGGSDSAALGVGAASRYAMKMYFEESPGDFGIEVGFGTVADLSTIAATAGAGNLDRALEMVVFALRSYDVEWPDDKFQDTILPFLRRQEGGAVGRFEHSYRDALFRGHPSGASPTGDQIAATKKGEIAGWLERAFNPRNALLVIAGDVDPKQVEADGARGVRQLEARGRGGGAARSIPGIGAGAPPAVVPSIARAGFWSFTVPAPPRSCCAWGACCRPVMRAPMRCATSRPGSSRTACRTVLRRRMGSTYGVHVGAVSRRGAGTVLQVSASFDNASFPAAWSELQSGFRFLGVGDAGHDGVGRVRSRRPRERPVAVPTSVPRRWPPRCSTPGTPVGRWIHRTSTSAIWRRSPPTRSTPRSRSARRGPRSRCWETSRRSDRPPASSAARKACPLPDPLSPINPAAARGSGA